MRLVFYLGILIVFSGISFYGGVTIDAQAKNLTVKEYLAKYAAKNAKIVAPGKLRLVGRRRSCGKRVTVLDPKFSDYGGAYPDFLILNPVKLKKLPAVIQFYVFAHECGHQFRGANETAADCFAVKRGRRRGWLSPKGMDQICKFMWSHTGDTMHLPGPERCRIMKRCYKEAGTRKAKN